MEAAFQQFQASALHLRQLAKDRDAAERPYEVHFVACHCEGSLGWLSELLPKAFSASATLFSYSTCSSADAGHHALAGLPAAFATVHALQAPADAAGARGECAARGVLAHVAEHHAAPPAFTVFLAARAPEGAERRLLDVLAQSLARRTLDVAFLPLGFRRSPPSRASDCSLAVWRATFGEGAPRGYEVANFVVSGARLLQRPAAYFQHLLGLLDAPPGECQGDMLAAHQAFIPAWHAVFGEAPQAPLRADDPALPLFLRFVDAPSGFQGTRMPKTSIYLSSAEALAYHVV